MVGNVFGFLLGATLAFPAPKSPPPDDKAPGFFGIQLLEETGVKVTLVQPGSPAEKGGVKVGDKLLTINDERVNSVNECRETIGKLRPGNLAKVEVRRGETTVLLKVPVGAKPPLP